MSISSMISNLKKLNFCNFFPHFPLLVRPCVFPFRWHLRTRHPPSKSPAFPPFIFSFRGRPSQPPSPQQFPLSSSLSERPTGKIYTKNQTVLFKTEAFPGGIITCTGQEEGAFQGDFRVFWLEESASFGRFWGSKTGENFRDFSAVESP